MKKTNDKNTLPVAADKLPAYRKFEEYLKGLLENARKAPALYVKASNLEGARKWQRLALAMDAKEFAQLAGKTVCLIEADIAAATPPIPQKDRNYGKKDLVAGDATRLSKFTLSKIRRAYPGSVSDVAARCDKAIADGRTPSREMFLHEADIAMNKERLAAVAREKAARRAKPHESKIQLYALPIQKLAPKVPPESVDLIFTDPPYEKPGVHLYSALLEFGEHALKPGGSLLAISGSAWLPEIIRRISAGKRVLWHWALKYVMGGGETRNHNRRVFGACKLVLWLVKGKYEGYWVNDKITVPPKPKGYKLHKWAQTAEGMDAILAKGFAFPGQTVCDPFLGAGSTALAAVHRKCNFIGSDIDPENIKITKDRLAAGWQPEKAEKGGAAEPEMENPSNPPLDIRQILGLPPEKESPLKRPLESMASSLEEKNRLLERILLTQEKRLTGQVYSNFDSEKALKEKEAKKRELAADQQKSSS